MPRRMELNNFRIKKANFSINVKLAFFIEVSSASNYLNKASATVTLSGFPTSTK